MNEIPGLPEGVEIVRYGEPRYYEFVFLNNRICSCSLNAKPCSIVRPLPGWEFTNSPGHNEYVATKRLPLPCSIHAIFEPTTEQQRQELIAELGQMPGWKTTEEIRGPGPVCWLPVLERTDKSEQ